MNKPSKKLIEMGKKISLRSPLWVQGNGGNISEKNDLSLLIKASGARLEDMGLPGNYAHVAMGEQEVLNDLLNEKTIKAEDQEIRYCKWIEDASIKGGNCGRASMETGFHLFLKKKFVLHFHSVASLLLAYELKKNMKILNEINTEGLDVCHLEFLTPGLELTQALQNKKDHDAYILDNHGIILQGEDERVLEKWNELEARFLKEKYPDLYTFYHQRRDEVLKKLGQLKSPMRFYFPDTAVYYAQLSECITLTPDGEFEFLEAEKKAKEYIETKDWKKLNLLELWAATTALNRYCPGYPEIPDTLIDKITNLPSEAFRKMREN